jgi:hypothetical protein
VNVGPDLLGDADVVALAAEAGVRAIVVASEGASEFSEPAS